jgi:hypothetical protein
LAWFQIPYKALRRTCNLWRNWMDIQSDWASLKSIITFWAEASQLSEGFTEVAGPGAFNDPDMLIIGNEVWRIRIHTSLNEALIFTFQRHWLIVHVGPLPGRTRWELTYLAHMDMHERAAPRQPSCSTLASVKGVLNLVSALQGITDNQARLQMGAWAIFAAPLIMGNDVRNLSDAHLSILLNKDVIAINQDPAGRTCKPHATLIMPLADMPINHGAPSLYFNICSGGKHCAAQGLAAQSVPEYS